MAKIYVLLIAAILVGEVKGNCLFTYGDVLGSNGIFTYRDAQGNLQLQLSSRVNNGVTLTMYCGGGETHTITCKTENEESVFEPQLPIRCTRNPPESTVEPYTGDKRVYADCPKEVYSTGHKINGQFLKLYDVCYDKKASRAIYSQARIFPHNIILPRPTNLEFSRIPVMTEEASHSFYTNSIYQRFLTLYGIAQTYIPRGVEVINRGHLTARRDFLFEDQMKSTFKLINVVPQFAEINRRNWGNIERYVHTQVLDDTGLIVRTGGFGTLELKKYNNYKSATLISGATNPVPKWIYKRITRKNPNASGFETAIFPTYNNIFEVPHKSEYSFCAKVPCDFYLPEDKSAGYTICCHISQSRIPV